MLDKNHPTMKENLLEKEKDENDIMQLLCFPLPKLVLCHDPCLETTTMSASTTLIPRVVTTNNIQVFAIGVDIRMDCRRQPANHLSHGTRATDMINDMDLHKAAYNGNIDGAQEVVHRNKALIWRKDPQGNLPLHLAVEKGHYNVASYLVEQYPQGSYVLNCMDISPIYHAVVHHNKELVEYMLLELVQDGGVSKSLKRGKSIVRAAITTQKQEMLEIILKYQPDLIKATDEEGLTPLTYAASNGFINIVRYLIDNFPKSVYYRNQNKSYPIHKACIGGHVDVLELFRSYHSKSFVLGDQHGRTILHLAAKERGNKLKNVVLYLLTLQEEGKFLINKQDENGCTALDLAKISRNNEVERLITGSMRKS